MLGHVNCCIVVASREGGTWATWAGIFEGGTKSWESVDYAGALKVLPGMKRWEFEVKPLEDVESSKGKVRRPQKHLRAGLRRFLYK